MTHGVTGSNAIYSKYPVSYHVLSKFETTSQTTLIYLDKQRLIMNFKVGLNMLIDIYSSIFTVYVTYIIV